MSRFSGRHATMSRKTQNRLRLASEIERNGRPVAIACERCISSNRLCIAMSNSSRLKCSECVRQGKPCVNLSWSALDRTREEYQKKVDNDEELLATVMARLMRNKKILRQAEERAKRKAECLADEMETSGEAKEPEDCPAADACVGLSPAVWESLAQLDNFIDFSADVPGVEGST